MAENRAPAPARALTYRARTWTAGARWTSLPGLALSLILACAAPASRTSDPHSSSAGESSGQPAAAIESIAPSAAAIERLMNATYQGIYPWPVRLSAGRFEGEPFQPGAASRPTLTLIGDPVAFADLDGDGSQEAVVVLVESSGGSGSFVYLAVVSLANGEALNLATAWVGDRARVDSLEAGRGWIRARFFDGRPAVGSRPQPIVREWIFRDGALTERESGVAAQPGD